jgi:hypothetical protein
MSIKPKSGKKRNGSSQSGIQRRKKKKSSELAIESNEDLQNIMETSLDVTELIFPVESQLFLTKVGLYQGFLVASVNHSIALKKPDIKDGSKRSTTQHNDKLRQRGFAEKRLAKKEKDGKTFFARRPSDEELEEIGEYDGGED